MLITLMFILTLYIAQANGLTVATLHWVCAWLMFAVMFIRSFNAAVQKARTKVMVHESLENFLKSVKDRDKSKSVDDWTVSMTHDEEDD